MVGFYRLLERLWFSCVHFCAVAPTLTLPRKRGRESDTQWGVGVVEACGGCDTSIVGHCRPTKLAIAIPLLGGVPEGRGGRRRLIF